MTVDVAGEALEMIEQCIRTIEQIAGELVTKGDTNQKTALIHLELIGHAMLATIAVQSATIKLLDRIEKNTRPGGPG